MGRRMMRALGAGLMEAGRQSEISRKEQLELKRQQNLKDIADGRQGIMRDQNNVMKQHYEGLANERKGERQNKAIEDVQKRIDALRQPGDLYLNEYMQTRAGIIKNGADLGAEEMQLQLDAAKESYKNQRLSELEPGSDAWKEREREISRYVGEVDSVLNTANRKLSKTVEGWTGDVADYLYLTPTAEASREINEITPGGEYMEPPPPEEPSLMDKLVPDFSEFKGLGNVGRDGGRGRIFEGDVSRQGTFGGHDLSPTPKADMEFPTERLDSGLMGQTRGADPMAEYRRLKFDESGNVITPGT